MKKLILAILLGSAFFGSPVCAEESPPHLTLMDRIHTIITSITHTPSSQQDIAVDMARHGHYDRSLAILDRLHESDKNNQSVARDYVTVLSWSGRDLDAINLYETIPPQEEDYLLAAVGHSYRKIGKTEQALATYREGLKKYPKNVLFIDGEIRTMADSGDLDGTLAKANEDLAKNGIRPEISAARNDLIQDITKRDREKAVDLARGKNYPEAIKILDRLHTEHPENLEITRDYLAVLDWTGSNDEQVVTLYKTLPEGDQPDYVLEAVGHAYRILKQPELAFVIYNQGLQKLPDSVSFMEGSIRCLVDMKKYDEALTIANQDLIKHGERPEILDIKKNIQRLKKPTPAPKHSKKTKHKA